jgi:hypothetical protein
MLNAILTLVAIWAVMILTAWTAASAAVAAIEALLQARRRPSGRRFER